MWKKLGGPLHMPFTKYLFIYLFWLHWALAQWHVNFLGVVGMWDLVPQPGSEPRHPLRWEHGAPPTGPPGKSP